MRVLFRGLLAELSPIEAAVAIPAMERAGFVCTPRRGPGNGGRRGDTYWLKRLGEEPICVAEWVGWRGNSTPSDDMKLFVDLNYVQLSLLEGALYGP